MGGRLHLRGCFCHVIGRCLNTSVLLTSPAVCPALPLFPWVRRQRRPLLLQVWNKHDDNLTRSVHQWVLASQSCYCLRLCHFPCLRRQNPHGNLQGEFTFLSLSWSQPLFLIPTADTVSLVLLTSIWLPIPSHKARWNYNPTLHSSNVDSLFVLYILSVLW